MSSLKVKRRLISNRASPAQLWSVCTAAAFLLSLCVGLTIPAFAGLTAAFKRTGKRARYTTETTLSVRGGGHLALACCLDKQGRSMAGLYTHIAYVRSWRRASCCACHAELVILGCCSAVLSSGLLWYSSGAVTRLCSDGYTL
jgi:hypothetical protein